VLIVVCVLHCGRGPNRSYFIAYSISASRTDHDDPGWDGMISVVRSEDTVSILLAL
jgi:hypothetical protein